MKDFALVDVCNECKIKVPRSVSRIYQDFEVETKSFLLSRVSEGDAFIDIGANFGFYTALAAQSVGDNGAVHSFEPSDINYRILTDNLSHAGNVKLHKYAIGAREARCRFYDTDDYVNSGLVVGPFQAQAVTSMTIVDVRPIGQLLAAKQFAHHERIFVKIDVQGTEIDAVTGLDWLLNDDRVLLVVEWAPAWLESAGQTLQELPRLLSQHGFIHQLAIDDWTKQTMTTEKMLSIFRQDDTRRRFCNLVASRIPF